MVRQLTNKVSPDVICESTFTYELPADYGDMLNGLDSIDETLHQSVFESIQRHLIKKFGDSLFFGLDLIPPYEEHEDWRKSLPRNDLGSAGRAPLDVSPLVVTTYDDLKKLWKNLQNPLTNCRYNV